MTFPTSMEVVYVPDWLPYDTTYPAMSDSELRSQARDTGAAWSREVMQTKLRNVRAASVRDRRTLGFVIVGRRNDICISSLS
jgi:hypothetical protein